MPNKINIDTIESIKQLEDMKISFEEAFNSLEKIISLQENSQISLEDNIRYYKIGKILSQYSLMLLEKAKLEIEKV